MPTVGGMTQVMNETQMLDFYTEQINAAVAAERDDIVRELAESCELELAEIVESRRAA